MKVCIIQPLYTTDYSRSDELFRWEMDMMDKCDLGMDLIVLPESTDVPAYAKTREMALASHEKYLAPLLQKASETAKRCGATLFLNAYRQTETGLRNTTWAFNSRGEEAGYYYKQHLVPSEISERRLDSEYTWEYSQPDILEIDGIRYGFMTCYDFYFYEAFAALARRKPDIIIGCSHQRSDRHSALETIGRFLAYNTNAYLVRASVSMGLESELGGCSMVVSPDGTVLADMKSQVGMTTVEIDPAEKYYKPGGFGNPEMAHWEYIEKGRRPWKYRPGGSAIVRHDVIMPYPRMCAHRGFNTVAPENTMPAFGAAVALGAQEIEFDLWWTRDGEIVSIHDSKLDRVSDGTGLVYEKTYEELQQYDFGVKFGEKFKGLRIITFEDILKKFSSHVVMNVHLKTIDNHTPWEEAHLRRVLDLIEQYDCKKYVYFMTGSEPLLAQLRAMAPEICRCAGAGDNPWEIVETAMEYDCQKVQLFKPYFNQEMIDKAHANGIICNVFWSDDLEETRRFLDMGIDVILTNDYLTISQAIR